MLTFLIKYIARKPIFPKHTEKTKKFKCYLSKNILVEFSISMTIYL